MRHPREIDLPLTIDRQASTPLPTQIVDGIRAALESGQLLPGEPLPSTRTWASSLGVSRGTVVAAFDQLSGEGWLVADRGSTRVDPELGRHAYPPSNAGPQAVETTTPAPHVAKPRAEPAVGWNLRPGHPDVSTVVDASWRAAWRAATSRPWTVHPAQGSPDLRTALADHLRTARRTTVDPTEIMITAGVREGLTLLLSTLSGTQRRTLTVAVENPGFPALHRVIRAGGHELVPVTVDERGLQPDQLSRLPQPPDLVLLTPGHQYPLGGAIPVAARLDLIRWATDNDSLIIEDDYDSELRFNGPPLPALAALDRQLSPGGDRVVLLGSFAKLLAPGLGIGHLIMPGHLRSTMINLRRALGNPVPAITQDALAAYLQVGALRRHTARMRRRYRQRSDLAVRQFQDNQLMRLQPMDGGLHAVISVADPTGSIAEDALLAHCLAAGVNVSTLGEYWTGTPATSPSKGLVIGLGAADFADGLAALGRALDLRPGER